MILENMVSRMLRVPSILATLRGMANMNVAVQMILNLTSAAHGGRLV